MKEHTGKGLSTCASSVILDRFLDTITIALLALIGTLFIAGNYSGLIYAPNREKYPKIKKMVLNVNYTT